MVNNLIEKKSLTNEFFDNMYTKKNIDLDLENKNNNNNNNNNNKLSKIDNIKNKYLYKAIKRSERKKDFVERVLKEEASYFNIEYKLNNIMKRFIDKEGNHLF